MNVIVEASRDRVDQILRVSPTIRNLVVNQWIHLLAIDGEEFYECRGVGAWRVVAVGELG